MAEETICNAGNITLGICNTVAGSRNLISGDVEYNNYGYLLSGWSVYLFLVVFTLAFLAHMILGIWKRTWWVIATMGSGTALEVLGWGGRLWSKTGTYWAPNSGGYWSLDYNGFIMQIVCLVIGPCFYSAANYILLGRLMRATGPEYPSLSVDSFAKIFMIVDFLCLLVQAVGGGLAGTADTNEGANNGAYIMTAGVVLQLVVTVFFLILLFEFLYRKSRNALPRRQFNPLPTLKCWDKRANKHNSTESNLPMTGKGSRNGGGGYGGYNVKYNLTVFMICWTTFLIIVRSLYRSVELSRGWSGPVATNQPLFLGMDAFLMALVAWSYVIVHPSMLLGEHRI